MEQALSTKLEAHPQASEDETTQRHLESGIKMIDHKLKRDQYSHARPLSCALTFGALRALAYRRVNFCPAMGRVLLI